MEQRQRQGNGLSIQLSGGLLRLEVASAWHASALSRVLDGERSRLSTWWPLVDELRGTETVARYLAAGRRSFLNGTSLPYLIMEGGQPVGEVSLAIDEENRSADLSYWLADQYQGRGIARQAARILINQAFDELNLIRIQAGTIAGNDPSENLLQSLGFRLEGTLRRAVLLSATPVDLVIYGLLAEEFEGQACGDPVCYGAAAKA